MAHDATSEPEEWSDTDLDDASDTEVGDALDWLEAVEGPDGSARPFAAFSAAGGVGAARRPNAHGGVLSRPLQPLSNRTQKLASHIRAAPLEVRSFNFSLHWLIVEVYYIFLLLALCMQETRCLGEIFYLSSYRILNIIL